MIHLVHGNLRVKMLEVTENDTKAGIKMDEAYPVIGTYNRQYVNKDGNEETQDFFVINANG